MASSNRSAELYHTSPRTELMIRPEGGVMVVKTSASPLRLNTRGHKPATYPRVSRLVTRNHLSLIGGVNWTNYYNPNGPCVRFERTGAHSNSASFHFTNDCPGGGQFEPIGEDDTLVTIAEILEHLGFGELNQVIPPGTNLFMEECCGRIFRFQIGFTPNPMSANIATAVFERLNVKLVESNVLRVTRNDLSVPARLNHFYN